MISQRRDPFLLLSGHLIGGTGYEVGLTVSTRIDLPNGAVIVWCIAIIAPSFKLIKNNNQGVVGDKKI